MRARCAALAVPVAIVALVAAGCSEPRDEPAVDPLTDDVITVASFDFAESEVVAELYSQALESRGHQVERRFGLGPRELVAPALSAGLVELVPEYAGTAVRFLSVGSVTPTADERAVHGALVDVLDGRPITALTPAPGQDANAFVVTPQTARRFALRRISDLVRVAPTLRLGGPPECRERPLCLRGLEDVYFIRFGEFVALDAAGPRTHQALRDGYVDVALLFTTDPTITTEGWVELEDDRQMQPAENVTPLVRTEVIDRWGHSVVDALDAVSRHLTTDELRALNGEVATGDRPTAEVARRWLEEHPLR